MTISSHHLQACYNTWLQSENLLVSIAGLKNSISQKLHSVVDECSLICMGTIQAIKTKSQHLHRIALLCVGICEECAEMCERYDDARFRDFAQTCRLCSESLSQIAFTNLQ